MDNLLIVGFGLLALVNIGLLVVTLGALIDAL
jgi:hypothetical protein